MYCKRLSTFARNSPATPFGRRGLRQVFALLAALSVTLLSPATRAANELTVPFEVVFDVSMDGSGIGQYAMRVSAERSVYTVQSTLTPQGLAQLFAGGQYEQNSRFLIRKGRVVPLLYHERREGKEPPEWKIKFDWTFMHVVLPSGETRDMPRQPLDPASAPLQVMLTPPAPDRDLKVHLVNDRGVRRHIFSLKGEEVIETSIGTLKTITIRQRKAGDKPENFVDIWLAPERGNVPVKIVRQKGSRRIVFTLATLQLGP